MLISQNINCGLKLIIEVLLGSLQPERGWKVFFSLPLSNFHYFSTNTNYPPIRVPHLLCSSYGIVHSILKLLRKRSRLHHEGSLWQTLFHKESRERAYSQDIFCCVWIQRAWKGWGWFIVTQTEFKCCCQHLEPVLNLQWRKAPRLSKNTLQWPIRKILWFKSSFAQNGRWVLAAVPSYGSPSSFSGWGNWVYRRTYLQLQTAADNHPCLRPAPLHSLYRFLSCLL